MAHMTLFNWQFLQRFCKRFFFDCRFALQHWTFSPEKCPLGNTSAVHPTECVCVSARAFAKVGEAKVLFFHYALKSVQNSDWPAPLRHPITCNWPTVALLKFCDSASAAADVVIYWWIAGVTIRERLRGKRLGERERESESDTGREAEAGFGEARGGGGAVVVWEDDAVWAPFLTSSFV